MTHKLNQGDNLIIQSKGLSSTLSKIIIVDVTETTILIEYVDNPPSRQVRLSKKYFDENFEIIESLEQSYTISISPCMPDQKYVTKEAIVYKQPNQ